MVKNKKGQTWLVVLIIIGIGVGIYFYSMKDIGNGTVPKNTENQIISNAILEVDKILDRPYNKQGIVDTQTGCSQYIGQTCVKKSTIHYVTFDINGGGETKINTKINSIEIDSDSLRINFNLDQEINFDPRYIKDLCNLPSLNIFESFIEGNTKLSLVGVKKYVDINHNDLRDSSENIVAIQYGNNYDINADGIIDKTADFYHGYINNNPPIRLLYSLTQTDVKYVTIHSANVVNYVTNDDWELRSTGSRLEIRRFTGFQSGQKTYPSKCEKYYLLPKEQIFGIPCEDDWGCHLQWSTLTEPTCNLETGKCNYNV